MNGYKIVSEAINCPDVKNQGLAYKKNLNPDNVDQSELAMGIEVEYEHSSDKKIATRIALAHLKELPDYYTRLKKMEAEGEKTKA